MTLKELYIAIGEQQALPAVEVLIDDRSLKKGMVGQVEAVKDSGGYVGVGVSFPEEYRIPYNVWFHAETDREDGRKRYMSVLKIYNQV